jgi:[ribosomal protein S5]-alanine N-acetyltransferase
VDEDFLLETERLRLRAYRHEDADALAPMFADAEHMRYYPSTYGRDETDAWVARNLDRYRDDGFGLWIVEERATGEIVGTVGPTVQVVEGVREVEIGWHVRPGWKGRGIAPEAAAAARDWAFENLDVDHLISLVRPENHPSARVAEKIGMHVDREVEFKGLPHLVYRVDLVTTRRPDEAGRP